MRNGLVPRRWHCGEVLTGNCPPGFWVVAVRALGRPGLVVCWLCVCFPVVAASPPEEAAVASCSRDGARVAGIAPCPAHCGTQAGGMVSPAGRPHTPLDLLALM